MKKLISSTIVIFSILSLVGCENKHSFVSLITNSNNTNPQIVNTTETTETNNEQNNDKNIGQNETSSINNEPSESTIDANDYEILEDIDYFEFDYTSEDGVFTITALKNKINKDNDIVTPITQVRGYISGISGTYFMELPYTKKWKNGDKVDIIYKKSYDYDKDETIITDILYVDPSFKQPKIEEIIPEIPIATVSEIEDTINEAVNLYKVIDEVNVRDKATTKNSKILGKLKLNDEVEVLAEEGEWAKIMYKEQEAWVNKKYIQKVE